MCLKVFKSLVPDRLPTGTGSISQPLPTDIQISRKALLALCLTSKECYNLALPLLYKHIIITDRAQMASLLVTITFQKDRRAWTRRLAVIQSLKFTESGVDLLERAISWLGTHEMQHEEQLSSSAEPDDALNNYTSSNFRRETRQDGRQTGREIDQIGDENQTEDMPTKQHGKERLTLYPGG
ncbi:hypothetical protein DHEL01_v204469 [Diaporthe helianthi]|uniref:Uncharacterized protein n=1 Tax=Diaporthe helianthi TaxID=158607 RepID=A0A2P5I3T6_DIAHE|nr:hypothetical protein DHEL01_v204469 [Diaporthe helianthi]